MISRHSLLNAQHQAFLSRLEQELKILRDLTNGNCKRRVTIIVAVADSVIDAQNVSFSQSPLRWNPVDHFFIDRRTQCRRKPMIPLEGRASAMLASHVFRDAVELQRRDTRLAH